MARARVAITAVAANTSLGDVRTACAAARAGISRPGPLDIAALDEGEELPVIGHVVPFVDGFQGEARLLSLSYTALADLIEAGRLEAGEPVGLLLALPDLSIRAAAAGGPPPPPVDLVERMVSLSRAPTPPELRQIFRADHVGFALAVRAALDLLQTARVKACVVGAVDTLLDNVALDALAAQRRLKTPEQPVGVAPGEAAAFLLLEPTHVARRREAPILAEVVGVGVAEESKAGKAPPVGRGLAAALDELVATAGPLPPRETFFVTDLNGETRRANDWGCCLQRLTERFPGLLPAPTWYPAVSFGETGAASGALSAQMAVAAFTRGYARGKCAVIISSSDGRQRTAVRLDQPN